MHIQVRTQTCSSFGKIIGQKSPFHTWFISLPQEIDGVFMVFTCFHHEQGSPAIFHRIADGFREQSIRATQLSSTEVLMTGRNSWTLVLQIPSIRRCQQTPNISKNHLQVSSLSLGVWSCRGTKKIQKTNLFQLRAEAPVALHDLGPQGAEINPRFRAMFSGLMWPVWWENQEWQEWNNMGNMRKP